MSRPGNEYERHVAGAGDFENRRGQEPGFQQGSRRHEEDDDLIEGMSEAGTRADEWRQRYERGREGVMDRGRRRLSDAYDSASGWLEDHAGGGRRYARRSMRDTRHSIEDYFHENPLMVGAVGLGLGLLLGALLPAARAERRALRPFAEDMRQSARHYGAEAVRSVRKEGERMRDEMESRTDGGATYQ